MLNVLANSTIGEARIDTFTWKGGQGDVAPSPPLAIEEEFILYANVTYGGWPEPNARAHLHMCCIWNHDF